MIPIECISIDGAVLCSWTQGRGVPVVLFHGGPGGYDELEPVASMISDVAQVHRFDQRACGHSTGEPPFTVSRWLRDIEALRAHWGHKRWLVAGHSFGAALALAYAVAHPEHTLALVYMSCLPTGDPTAHAAYIANRHARIPPALRERFAHLRRLQEEGADDPRAAAELYAMGLRAEFSDPTVAEQFVPRMLAEERTINRDVNRKLGADFARHCEEPAFRVRLEAFARPALIVHGKQDLRPAWVAKQLARRLKGSSYAEVIGGHFPWCEAPEQLRPILRAFLCGLDA
jgi:proline iminopeptidase